MSDGREEVIVIGRAPTHITRAADNLLDGISIALDKFDTATLRAIADDRDEIRKDGWMQRMIREFIEVYR